MSKKIGTYLMIILVIWAVLLLDATQNRGPHQPVLQSVTQPVESTGAPTQSTAPESMPPETTVPETTVPDTTVPETTEPEKEPTNAPDISRVEVVLNRHSMNRTAVTQLVREGETGDSHTGDLAELSSRRKVNPIAAFWVLVSEGLYERDGEKPGLLLYELPELPAQAEVRYSYTDAGAEALLTDLLTLAGEMTDGMKLEKAILGADGAVDPGDVTLSEEDACYYAYFARTTERSTQILCFYLRGGEWITDVEFQLLHMTDSADPEPGNGQAASLAAAAELLMTGTARAGTEDAAAYEVSGCKATAERFFFTAEEEEGSLTNYRLRK